MIPIYLVGKRGLVYDVEVVKHLREVYHICGTLTGVLPQFPQQNVFKGLPLELLPEDMELLVNELRIAYIVDDASIHKLSLDGLTEQDREKLESDHKRAQLEALQEYRSLSWTKKELALRKHDVTITPSMKESFMKNITEAENTMFETPNSTGLEPYKLLRDNLSIASAPEPVDIPGLSPHNYVIYKYFQERGFYICSALRFGAQFMTYPGDPLRYHSHYIADGYEWDEEFDLLDLATKGRLATTVKKCWVMGSKDENNDVHVYSIEWARFG